MADRAVSPLRGWGSFGTMFLGLTPQAIACRRSAAGKSQFPDPVPPYGLLFSSKSRGFSPAAISASLALAGMKGGENVLGDIVVDVVHLVKDHRRSVTWAMKVT